MTAKEKVVVILGPTATGKTACGILLAQKLKGEIISGDSMLVFRGMDIATAKPTLQERALAVHHLIDVRDPEEKYSAFDFKREAASLIQEIHGRGHMPIIVGGTGLYLKALLENYHFQPAKNKPSDVRPLQIMPIAMAMRPSIKNWKNLMKKRRID